MSLRDLIIRHLYVNEVAEGLLNDGGVDLKAVEKFADEIIAEFRHELNHALDPGLALDQHLLDPAASTPRAATTSSEGA